MMPNRPRLVLCELEVDAALTTTRSAPRVYAEGRASESRQSSVTRNGEVEGVLRSDRLEVEALGRVPAPIPPMWVISTHRAEPIVPTAPAPLACHLDENPQSKQICLLYTS